MSDLSQVVPLPVRRLELGLSLGNAAELANDLRPYVPDIAAEAVLQIEKEVPELTRPHDRRYAEVLALSVEYAIGHFLDLMADPTTSSTEVLDFWRRVGEGEASEGRTLDAWQTATGIGAGLAVARLTAVAERLGHATSGAAVASVVNAVFGYLNKLAAVVAEGHADAAARATGAIQDRRRLLVEMLLSEPAAHTRDLREVAQGAGWPLPRTVAAVALKESGPDARRPALPPDVLLGLHLPEPCLIVPDPEGPGRQRALEMGLQGWHAALGPTAGTAELAQSLRLARTALDLGGRGLIEGDGLIVTERHMPIIVMMQESSLVERVINRRLAPLFTVRPPQRFRLAETLMLALECGFNATEVSARLHMHAQTIRYRLRRLEELFGEAMHDTTGRLELHMALHAWLALNAEPPANEQLRYG